MGNPNEGLVGFAEDGRVIVKMNPRLAGYRPEHLAPLYRRIRETLWDVPGVAGLALCNYSPMDGNFWGSGVWVDGRPAPGPHDNYFAGRERVTPGYFAAYFRVKMRLGNISVGMAWCRGGSTKLWVAKDALYLADNPTKRPIPMFFLPEPQLDLSLKTGTPVADGTHFLSDIVIVTRPGAIVTEGRVRQAMAAVDPELPVILVRTLREQVEGQFRQQWLMARLMSMFGVLSLVLASIGLYGVTAYNVGRRTNEIGVRMAVGAVGTLNRCVTTTQER